MLVEWPEDMLNIFSSKKKESRSDLWKFCINFFFSPLAIHSRSRSGEKEKRFSLLLVGWWSIRRLRWWRRQKTFFSSILYRCRPSLSPKHSGTVPNVEFHSMSSCNLKKKVWSSLCSMEIQERINIGPRERVGGMSEFTSEHEHGALLWCRRSQRLSPLLSASSRRHKRKLFIHGREEFSLRSCVMCCFSSGGGEFNFVQITRTREEW